MSQKTNIGIDVSKRSFDVFIHETNEYKTFNIKTIGETIGDTHLLPLPKTKNPSRIVSRRSIRRSPLATGNSKQYAIDILIFGMKLFKKLMKASLPRSCSVATFTHKIIQPRQPLEGFIRYENTWIPAGVYPRVDGDLNDTKKRDSCLLGRSPLTTGRKFSLRRALLFTPKHI